MKIKQGGSGLMLSELLLAVMFFSLAAAICLQIFVSAKETGDLSMDLSHAALEAQSIAECFKASGGDLEKTADILSMELSGENLIIGGFDAHWDKASSEDIIYSAELIRTLVTDVYIEAKVIMYKGDTELFALDVGTIGGALS